MLSIIYIQKSPQLDPFKGFERTEHQQLSQNCYAKKLLNKWSSSWVEKKKFRVMLN